MTPPPPPEVKHLAEFSIGHSKIEVEETPSLRVVLDFSTAGESGESRVLQQERQHSYSDTLLTVRIAERGILCESSCEKLKQTVSQASSLSKGIAKQLRLHLILDFATMINSGGITYFLPTQLALFASPQLLLPPLTHLSLHLSSESFNSQCLSALQPGLSLISQLISFTLHSQMRPTPSIEKILQTLSRTTTAITLNLRPSEGIQLFSQLEKFPLLDELSLELSDIDEKELQALLGLLTKLFKSKPTKSVKGTTKSLHLKHLALKWSEHSSCSQLYLTSKDTFYNNLSAIFLLLLPHAALPISIALDLTGVEDSGIKIDLIEALSRTSSDSIRHLSLAFQKCQLKTQLITLLYKLAKLFKQASRLQTLHIALPLPEKLTDLLAEAISNASSLTTTATLQSIHVNIGGAEDATAPPLRGVRFPPNATSIIRLSGISLSDASLSIPPHLLYYQISTTSNSTASNTTLNSAICRLLSARNYTIRVLAAMQNSSVAKRKDIILEVLSLFSSV